jgi:hypothetical protein
MIPDVDSWEVGQRLFEDFLVDRVIQDTDVELSAFLNPDLRLDAAEQVPVWSGCTFRSWPMASSAGN